MQPAIEIRGVEKSFGAVRALAGVDLSVERGEALALLGPNGAGKSTLIHIVAGLSRADAGAVSVLGHDVVRGYRAARRALGVVPQELVFDPFFQVREVLRLQAGYFGLGREQDRWIDELLAALGLTDKAGAAMRTLSGGMKRRVLIAQALVHRPDVIVLDEPTAGVDVEMRRSLYRLCERLVAEGCTIVLVTHHFEEAQALCGRVAVLVKGRIAALDTKDRLASGTGGLEKAVMDLVHEEGP
jgi:ABC-2 type transport system ATP-binding protein